MSKCLHYLQHVPFEGPGCIETWAVKAGFRMTASRMYTDDRLPSMEDFDWLVVMGGPMNIYEDIQYPWLKTEKAFIGRAIKNNKVVLGICLGAQLIADVLGAPVKPNRYKEIGWHPVYKIKNSSPSHLASVFHDTFVALHWHGDTFDLPDGALHLARSAACDHQAFVYRDHVVALQFHLETTRESLQSLIKHCKQDIDNGPFVQSPESMMASLQQFLPVNQVMNRLLNRLAGLNISCI